MSSLYQYRGHVLRVIDADTLLVRVDVGFRMYAELPLRLAYVDAPEANSPEGKAATAWAAEWLGELPAEVRLETLKPADKYGRYLAKVYKDGRSLGDDLIDAQHAELY